MERMRTAQASYWLATGRMTAASANELPIRVGDGAWLRSSVEKGEGVSVWWLEHARGRLSREPTVLRMNPAPTLIEEVPAP
jgi:hypothetical protein